jgi:hypothetical protein
MKLPAHDRYDYVAIHTRPQYDWPESLPKGTVPGSD